MAPRVATRLAALAAGRLSGTNNSMQLQVARRLLSGGAAMTSVEREFESLYRSQVRELEAESHAKTPVKKALPKFKRSLVESRRAMRSLTATPCMSAALITAIPMTVLTVSTTA